MKKIEAQNIVRHHFPNAAVGFWGKNGGVQIFEKPFDTFGRTGIRGCKPLSTSKATERLAWIDAAREVIRRYGDSKKKSNRRK